MFKYGHDFYYSKKDRVKMGKKIKVLQVIGSLRIGGAENVAMNFCRYLDKNKFQCDFLVFGENIGDYEKEAINLGSNVIHIPLPSENYKDYFSNLKKVLRDGKYDIVHSHILLNNGLVLKAAYEANIKKRFTHSHSTDSGQSEGIKYKIYKTFMKKLIRKYATQFIACGEEAGKYLYGGKFFKRKGIVVNNGIDTQRFKYNYESRERIRNEFGLGNKFVIGHIGRLAAVKNHNFLLDVFYEVNKLEPDSILLLVGDGELRNAVESKVRTLGLEGKVIITGTRSDIFDILQGMDVFIFPSLYEGLPLTLIEAQSSGLKCFVSSSVTPQVEVTDLITFVSLEKPAKEWAKKILKDRNYKRCNKSDEITRKGFDVYNTIKELEKLYEV